MLMIDPETLFGLAGGLILPLWLLLIASLWIQRLQAATDWVAFIGLPLLFGVLYLLLMGPHVPFEEGGFGSLAEVRALFAHDERLLAGWLHFLVFDYFVGGWIARDQRQQPVHALLIVPCLILCFLAGPLGLLLYLLLRACGRLLQAGAQTRAAT